MSRTKSTPCIIVIKLGTSSIVHEETHQPLLSTLSSVVETVVHLRKQGHKVVLVSSGAIGVGLRRMNIASRPKSLSGTQALAAIGQGRLIALYDELFGHLEQPIAQVLLTRGDISDRTRYLNAVNTLNELLSMGVIPIVNENDTISVSEIKFGDNDTLSAITSSMIHADYLFLLTDVDGLYTANPRKDSKAKQIEVVTSISAIRSQGKFSSSFINDSPLTSVLVSTTTLGSSLGTGGMETKIIAAEIATGAGVTTVITSSKRPENIFAILEYHDSLKGTALISESSDEETSIPLTRPPHTVFMPSLVPMRDLKAWTSHTLFPAGSVVIDSGAHRVLSRRESGGRLLAAGVIGVMGAFASGQAVRIVILASHEETDMLSAQPSRPASPRRLSPNAIGMLSRSSSSGNLETIKNLNVEAAAPQFSDHDVIEVGRGLAMYNYAQISKVRGLNSSHLAQVLGYADSEYVVENITIRVPPRSTPEK
ncbi:glutamate 5-kinase [Lentinula aff. lateritia]|uniref:Glutamate 5-kinase n=1 Tax=Lentinula aff. lateritia TaxID=2804960 RepID=A0ACC1TRL9_9AGAR|nr:glutamate 5-kinase [Lentinula aff. lateritia]